MFLFRFIACRLAPHKEQQQSRSHTLQDEPTGYHLLIAPALALAHMVVERGQGVFQNPDVQKALQTDLQNAQAAVYDEQGLIYDKERAAILEQYGVKVLRFSNLEGERNFQGVCTAIDLAVKERIEQLSTSE